MSHEHIDPIDITRELNSARARRRELAINIDLPADERTEGIRRVQREIDLLELQQDEILDLLYEAQQQRARDIPGEWRRIA